jgi:hypothetical protein
VDDDCIGSGVGTTCSPTTHQCVGCASDDDCYMGGFTHCNIPTSTCQCQSDDDCTDPSLGAPGTDKCVNGACGCSSASACSDYPDATAVCN